MMEDCSGFSSLRWLEEERPYVLELEGTHYLRTKYVISHWDDYIKWLNKKSVCVQPWAFTLTTNEKDKEKWPAVEDQMKQAALKILNQQTCPVKSGECYLEYTEAGAPHIHGFYIMDEGKRIFSKIFKRYWPLWDEKTKIKDGHKGGYHARVINEIRYAKYQSAEERLVAKVPMEE